jgi:zinc protease
MTPSIPYSRLARMVRAGTALLVAALATAGCAGMEATSPPAPMATPMPAPPAAASAPAPPKPAAAAAPAADLPPPVRQVLPNGLRLIVQDHRAADIVAVYLYVGVGVRYERPDQLGYSHFQEHMLFKGTDKWGPGYIDRAVEGVGGRTNATTSFDYTDFYIVVPTEAMEMAVQTLADMAVRSTFDPREVERERDVIFEEANIEADNPKSAIIRQLYGLVFADNPYGYPVLGTRGTMNAATSEKLKAYNKHYYTPENMTLVVAGPVEPARVRAVVDRIFGVLPATGYTPVPAPAPRRLTGIVRRTVERPEQQSFLAMGWQAPRSDDPNGDAVDLVTTILAGSESSRLVRRLRDEERLVSGVTMSYSAQMGGGIVSLRAELEAKDLPQVERIVLEEIAKMQESGPTEEERQLAVTKFEAQHAFDTETSEGLANAYALAETTWTLEAELGYVDRLRKITGEQIRDAARRYLPRTDYAQIAFVPKKP